MSLFRHVPTQLVESINRLNDAVATVADLIFDEVRPTTEAEVAQKGKNTCMRVRGNSHKYYGTKLMYYDRLNLQTAFANQMVKVTFLKPFNSLHSQIEQLNEEFAATFTIADFEDFTPEDPNAETGVLTLTAKADSLGWQGTVSLAYEVIDPIIMAIPDTELDGILTPNQRLDVEQATLMYAAFDFKTEGVWFEGLTPGVLEAGQISHLKDALLAVRPDVQWALTGSDKYSLEGVNLKYVGQDPENIVNSLYKQVAIFQLSESSTGVVGHLFLHYSKEGDDNV